METYDQKKRRIVGRQYLNRYLLELNNLYTVNIDASALYSIVETDEIRKSWTKFKNRIDTTILFTDKHLLHDKLKEFKFHLNDYYVIIGKFDYCGIPKLVDSSYFNINFNFEQSSHLLITLRSIDDSHKIVLSPDIQGDEEVLEISFEF